MLYIQIWWKIKVSSVEARYKDQGTCLFEMHVKHQLYGLSILMKDCMSALSQYWIDIRN